MAIHFKRMFHSNRSTYMILYGNEMLSFDLYILSF